MELEVLKEVEKSSLAIYLYSNANHLRSKKDDLKVGDIKHLALRYIILVVYILKY